MAKRTIRDLDTGLFLCLNGQWNVDARLAQNFDDCESAMLALHPLNIKNADLVTLNELDKVTMGKPLRISN